MELRVWRFLHRYIVKRWSPKREIVDFRNIFSKLTLKLKTCQGVNFTMKTNVGYTLWVIHGTAVSCCSDFLKKDLRM